MALFHPVPQLQLQPQDLTVWVQHCDVWFWNDDAVPFDDQGELCTVYNQALHLCWSGGQDNFFPVYSVYFCNWRLEYEAFANGVEDKGWPTLRVGVELDPTDLLGVVSGVLDLEDQYEVKAYARDVLRYIRPALDWGMTLRRWL